MSLYEMFSKLDYNLLAFVKLILFKIQAFYFFVSLNIYNHKQINGKNGEKSLEFYLLF